MNFEKYLNLYFKKFALKERSTILITGASGFISKYLIYALLSLKKTKLKVIGVDSVKPNFSHKNFIFIKKDLTVGNLEKILKRYKLTHIISLAGIPSPTDYKKKPLETIYLNSELTKILLKFCNKKKIKLTYFSSSEIYGNPIKNKIPTNENYNGNVSSIGPRSCYDESKRLGETLCYIYNKKYNTNINIIRPFNIYGPGMNKKDYRVMPNFVSNIINNKKLKIYGNGKQTRTYCYITDGLNGFIRVLALGKPGEVYNIGNTKPEISVDNLIKVIRNLYSKKILVKKTPYPKSYPEDEPSRRCPNISKAKRHLNFKPKIKLSHGIKKYINWAEIYYKEKKR